jgi:NAD(P)H-dependent FMN reductase
MKVLAIAGSLRAVSVSAAYFVREASIAVP